MKSWEIRSALILIQISQFGHKLHISLLHNPWFFLVRTIDKLQDSDCKLIEMDTKLRPLYIAEFNFNPSIDE